jgi:hypothetical protein
LGRLVGSHLAIAEHVYDMGKGIAGTAAVRSLIPNFERDPRIDGGLQHAQMREVDAVSDVGSIREYIDLAVIERSSCSAERPSPDFNNVQNALVSEARGRLVRFGCCSRM